MNGRLKTEGAWLQSPRWDGVWLLSTYWLFVLVGVFQAVPVGLKALLITVTVLLWFSHRVATLYTAFCMPAYRELIREQPGRFLIWPALVAVAVFGVLFAPEVAGFDFRTKLLILGTLSFIGETFHDGMQHYGVVTIYRVRAGQSPFSGLKRYEKFLCLTVGAILVDIGQLCHGAVAIRSSRLYETLRQVLPLDFFANAYGIMSVVGPFLALVLTAIWFIGEWRDQRRSWPKMLYVGGLLFQGFLVYYMHPLAFIILRTAQHYLVSLGLAGRMAEHQTQGAAIASGWYRFWGRFSGRFWPTLAILCVGSFALVPFVGYELLSSQVPGLFSPLTPILQRPGVANFFLGVGISTFFVHLLLDRAVFKLSNPRVRQVTGALIFGGPTGVTQPLHRGSPVASGRPATERLRIRPALAE